MKPAGSIKIGHKTIDKKSECFVIAEAGVNHNGDFSVAKEMIDVASECGVDAIKFQSFITKELILSNVDMASYQKANLKNDGSQYEMLKKLEVPANKMLELKEHAEAKNLIFLTTPFDSVSLHALDICDLDAYKVASTDTTNLVFLREMAAKGKPMLLSTGMTYFSEVQKVIAELLPINDQIILLHCTSNYPTDPTEVNLNVLKTFEEEFDIITGFSDHTAGIGASPYSVIMGAKVVEKHFTLDKSQPGPDHKASLEPDELTELVNQIRIAQSYLGSNVKMPTLSELGTRNSLQKSVVAKCQIASGEELTLDNLSTKRTGGKGIPAIYLDDLLGRTAQREYRADDIIDL
ncbi:N-acetylneuraminate synthase family protein [Roseivirga sp.]|uniref:N-acetylneuraminate synthase family protein n=1 Tax=Roseivirga sp. TaxID=1964215 RepID=UPI003B51AF59